MKREREYTDKFKAKMILEAAKGNSKMPPNNRTIRDFPRKCVKRGKELPKSKSIMLYSTHPTKKAVIS